MTPERMAEIARLAEAATPGPWRWADWSATFGTVEDPRRRYWLEHNATLLADPAPAVRTRQMGCIGILRVEDPVDTAAHDRYAADARFIAAARQAVPELLADNKDLLARVRDLEDARDNEYPGDERVVRDVLRAEHKECQRLRAECERLRAEVAMLRSGHWADCAINHGGAECDMGPECGLRPETRAELLSLRKLLAEACALVKTYDGGVSHDKRLAAIRAAAEGEKG